MSSSRPLHPGCGTVVYAQSSAQPQSSHRRPGSWIAGFSSAPPASITHTLIPASTRRRATTAPPLPEPITTTSNESATGRSYGVATRGGPTTSASAAWTRAAPRTTSSTIRTRLAPSAALLAAIRTVAAGDALLSPTITRRVIQAFTRVPNPSPPKELDELSERERDVFRLVARGLSNAEIGHELYISETTVKTHVTHILQKLDLRDRVQAVVLAYQTGVFEPDF